MKKHKIVWFYVFTVIFTVVAGGVSSAIIDASNPDHGVIVLVAAQMSPTLGLFLVCLFSKDFGAFQKINWGFDRKKWVWLLASMFFPAVIVCGSATIISIIGKPYLQSVYGQSIPLLVLIPLTVVGIIGEEIGWRGFLLPIFSEKRNLLVSSIFTGLLWGAWHFMKIASFGLLGYTLFILLCIEFSILMAWILSKTKHSLLSMIAFHFTVNTCSMFLLYDREGISFYISGLVIGGVLCGIAVLTNKAKFLSKLDT